MGDLTGRKEQILRAVIVEYVSAAEPVASDLIAHKYELGVKSATVRNEMAEITDLGLLEQPHTSAGRVPSDRGYRYYVNRLLVPKEPGAEERQRVRAAAEDEDTLKELLQGTTRALSRMTHLLSAAATIRDSEVPIRHAVVTALGPEKALLVLVLHNGMVENRLLDCPVGATLEHLGQANELISRTVDGLRLGDVAKIKPPQHPIPTVDKIVRAGLAAVKVAARDLTRGQLIKDGEEYITGQPEFRRDPESLAQLMESLEDDDSLYSALTSSESGDVTIGKEHASQKMHGLTVLRKTFFVGDDEAGTLAIVGPTRLDYDAHLSLLDFTSDAVSRTLTRFLK